MWKRIDGAKVYILLKGSLQRLMGIDLIKRVAEIVVSVTIVGGAVGWLFGPRVQEALGQEITAQFTEHKTKDHVPIETSLKEIHETLDTLTRTQKDAKDVQVQTTALLGLIVCKDAGGNAHPSTDGGRCLFTAEGVVVKSILLSDFNALFSEVLARGSKSRGNVSP